MKRMTLVFLLLCCVFFMTACDQDETYTIDDVKIEASIHSNGNVQVEEMYTYSFEGAFNGTTRSINGEHDSFEAYLIGKDNKELKPLKTEYDSDEEYYKIHTKSKNESKQVLYKYRLKDSIDKYQDVAEFQYAFFDDGNDSDIKNVEINVFTPNPDEKNIYSFIKGDAEGKLDPLNNGLKYNIPFLHNYQSTALRLVFPAEQVSKMKSLERDKPMLSKILKEEEMLDKRRNELDKEMQDAVPVIAGAIVLVFVFGLILYLKNPNRIGRKTDEETLFRILEHSDPLVVEYINRYGLIDQNALIPALISLKQRRVISMKMVPSKRDKYEQTIRFTLNDRRNLDEADAYMIHWLFTEKDRHGTYFLLESIVDTDQEADKVREEKAAAFDKAVKEWLKLVKEREVIVSARTINPMYALFSQITTVITFLVFYYFIKIDVLTDNMQLILTIIIGSIALSSLVLRKNKIVLCINYIIIHIATIALFTVTTATVLAVVLYLVTLIMLLIIPARIWNDDLRMIRHAIHRAIPAFVKKRYPVGTDAKLVERRLEFATILDQGKVYAALCRETKLTPYLDTSGLSLLKDPVATIDLLDPSSVVFYSVLGSSSTVTNTSSSSSSGGGGAGAF